MDDSKKLWGGRFTGESDETFEKFGFYAEHGVEEILVADPAARTVRLWQLTTDPPGYAEVTRSRLLDVRADELRDRISWP